MSVPRLTPDAAAPAAFDDRSTIDVAIDTAAASLRGSMMACEAEFGGDMSVTLEIIVRANESFLEDVEAAAGKDVADQYAAVLMQRIEER